MDITYVAMLAPYDLIPYFNDITVFIDGYRY